jgi:GxxExxY protein
MISESTNTKTKLFKKDLLYPELSYKINGVLFAAHNELGRYCNEQQYGDRVAQLLTAADIHYAKEKTLPPSFHGEHPGRNKVDFLIEDVLVLELKAKRLITKEDYYQVKRYLEALGKELALVVNFRQRYLTPKRILRNNNSGHSDTFVD